MTAVSASQYKLLFVLCVRGEQADA